LAKMEHILTSSRATLLGSLGMLASTSGKHKQSLLTALDQTKPPEYLKMDMGSKQSINTLIEDLQRAQPGLISL